MPLAQQYSNTAIQQYSNTAEFNHQSTLIDKHPDI
ncbi:hypothetical protein M233_04905 [Xylella fastidiosa subsp. multiplex Griffin-1]|nr:hypothetical protein M233_04905 [Xylella fastidiosa subsp. multiplex Griffin-1]